ncbi:MAG: radical SAM protein [Myxococcales bacterium]|nr:radical SAM protein [Myxococcales bacterium]
MHVTLVLTHRCNLACDYCYAGEHYKREMDDDTLQRAVALLVADAGASPGRARLGFFGGEPLLAEPLMRRAVSLARETVAPYGVELDISCTTNGSLVGPQQAAWLVENGVRVTVSIDGVREAHEVQRPCAGGRSSYDQCLEGLLNLLAAGGKPAAMMVVTPKTAAFLFRSVSWLWDLGVNSVHANVDVTASWSAEAREELGRELVAVGREQLARNLRGWPVSFDPFEVSLPDHKDADDSDPSAPRATRVVVATSGWLYSCAPMVGEDRDDGPEAKLRIGHVSDAPETIAAARPREGSSCGQGGACACAAYLETGDPTRGGPVGLWWGAVCRRIGFAIAAALDDQGVARPGDEQPRKRRRSRRGLVGLVAGVSTLLVGGGLYLQQLLAPKASCPNVKPTRPAVRGVTLGGVGRPDPEPPPAPGKMLMRPKPQKTPAAPKVAPDKPPKTKPKRQPARDMIDGKMG